MSRGTWGHRQYRLQDLAEELYDKETGTGRDDLYRDIDALPECREFAASMLTLLYRLINDMDTQIAGDGDLGGDQAILNKWLPRFIGEITRRQ